MDEPTAPDPGAQLQRAVERVTVHASLYREAVRKQHDMAVGALTSGRPDYSAAATACHRALQFQRQAEACETLARELQA